MGLGLGGWSAWKALEGDLFIARNQLGSWSAYTDLAAPQGNPYASAKAAQIGGLPMGLAEGFEFTATTDSDGAPLLAGCNYMLLGSVPQARLWTLDAVDEAGVSLLADGAPQSGINSRAIVHAPVEEAGRAGDGVDALVIAVGPDPAPGNWIQTQSSARLILTLRLYDTQVGSGVGVRDISLPRIVGGRAREGC